MIEIARESNLKSNATICLAKEPLSAKTIALPPSVCSPSSNTEYGESEFKFQFEFESESESESGLK